MRYRRGGAPRTRTGHGCLPGRKNAPPLISLETNRGSYGIHYLSNYLLSLYLNHRQKYILLHDTFPGMTLKYLTADARECASKTRSREKRCDRKLRPIRVRLSLLKYPYFRIRSRAARVHRTRQEARRGASSRIRPVVRHASGAINREERSAHARLSTVEAVSWVMTAPGEL